MVSDIVLYAILFAALLAVSIWMLLVGISAQKLGPRENSNKSNIVKAGLILLFGVGPLAYFLITDRHYSYELRQMEEMERNLTSSAIESLVRSCSEEQKFEALQHIQLREGVSIDTSLASRQKHLISSTPLPTPPPITWRQKLQQKRYGKYFPPGPDRQYNQPVSPDTSVNEGLVRKLIGDDFFVDYEPQDPYVHHQNPRKARYKLSFEDISTQSDRSKWIARVRMQLVDKSNLRIVATYTGFSANLTPMEGDTKWKYVMSCPLPDMKIDLPLPARHWRAYEQFLLTLASMRIKH